MKKFNKAILIVALISNYAFINASSPGAAKINEASSADQARIRLSDKIYKIDAETSVYKIVFETPASDEFIWKVLSFIQLELPAKYRGYAARGRKDISVPTYVLSREELQAIIDKINNTQL